MYKNAYTYKPKCILKRVHGSNSLGLIFIQKFFVVVFCGTFSLDKSMGRGIAMTDPAHVTPKVNLCMHTMY